MNIPELLKFTVGGFSGKRVGYPAQPPRGREEASIEDGPGAKFSLPPCCRWPPAAFKAPPPKLITNAGN